MDNNKKIVLLILAFPAACLAQGSSSHDARAPRFWTSAGLNTGEMLYHPTCQYTASPCDDSAAGEKLYVDGRFNDILGVELSYVHLGAIDTAGGGTGGGRAAAHAAGLVVTATKPLSERLSVVGKLGGTYGVSVVSGTAPGLLTGTQSGLEATVGADVRYAVSPAWALRLDADHYRIPFSDGEVGRVNAITAGVEYRFR